MPPTKHWPIPPSSSDYHSVQRDIVFFQEPLSPRTCSQHRSLQRGARHVLFGASGRHAAGTPHPIDHRRLRSTAVRPSALPETSAAIIAPGSVGSDLFHLVQAGAHVLADSPRRPHPILCSHCRHTAVCSVFFLRPLFENSQPASPQAAWPAALSTWAGRALASWHTAFHLLRSPTIDGSPPYCLHRAAFPWELIRHLLDDGTPNRLLPT
jgi:hypothetical protein